MVFSMSLPPGTVNWSVVCDFFTFPGNTHLGFLQEKNTEPYKANPKSAEFITKIYQILTGSTPNQQG